MILAPDHSVKAKFGTAFGKAVQSMDLPQIEALLPGAKKYLKDSLKNGGEEDLLNMRQERAMGDWPFPDALLAWRTQWGGFSTWEKPRRQEALHILKRLRQELPGFLRLKSNRNYKPALIAVPQIGIPPKDFGEPLASLEWRDMSIAALFAMERKNPKDPLDNTPKWEGNTGYEWLSLSLETVEVNGEQEGLNGGEDSFLDTAVLRCTEEAVECLLACGAKSFLEWSVWEPCSFEVAVANRHMQAAKQMLTWEKTQSENGENPDYRNLNRALAKTYTLLSRTSEDQLFLEAICQYLKEQDPKRYRIQLRQAVQQAAKLEDMAGVDYFVQQGCSLRSALQYSKGEVRAYLERQVLTALPTPQKTSIKNKMGRRL